jgi:NADPH-dependent 2,4-dienoyl-CoA reductase/sulfur reductase-like enzyme
MVGSTARRRLLVIGGDAAGMAAASQARRLTEPGELEIVVLERGRFTSYSACGIPYWISGMVDDRDDLVARSPEEHRSRGIDVRLHTEAVAIDTEAREVTARDLEAGDEHTLAYDELLVATGATPVRPPIDGIDSDGVLGVQTLEDGQAVLDALAARTPRRAVVVGAGYIGIEMAEAMVLRDLEVHVVDQAPQPMTTMDPALGRQVADAMRGMGMHLHLGAGVDEVVTGDDGWARGVVVDGTTLDADLVVLGTGTRPLTTLADEGDIPIGPSGGIVTDRRQRTPVEGVWAAGDCAESFHRVSRRPVSIALGTIANKQGRVAGLNLGGAYGAFPGVLGTAVTKVCSLELARTGLGEDEARDAGFEVVTATIEATTRAGYYPGATPLSIKLVAEVGSGRLLGGQIVGEEGAAKRIDVLALAVWNEMTVEDLSQADLSYAPPFSPVWDPVLIAARRTAAQL